MKPRIAVAAALVLASGLLGACSADSPPPGGGGDAVAADLMESRTDPGGGLPPSVPLSPLRNGRDGPSSGTPRRTPRSLDDLGWNEGDSTAPIRVVEFSDFGCGYCRKFHEETYPTLVEEYIATGKVQWKYVPMVLGIFGPNATAAAIAGECAGEQGHWNAARDSLFATQREWKQADDPYPVYRRIAGNVGADVERWERCVEDGGREERVVYGTELGRQAGVRGTPTFFIVGYQPIPGAIPLDIFREVLDTVWVNARREGGAG
jgi:hypothetical protein